MNIISVHVNQTNEYISCSTKEGFIIIRINPFNLIKKQAFGGSLYISYLLYSSNIMLLVGGIQSPVALDGPKVLTVWDMENEQIIKQVQFNHHIHDICSTLKYIVIQFHNYIEVMDLNTLQKVYYFSTSLYSPLSFTSFNNNSILCFCSPNTGELQIWKKKILAKFKASTSKCHGIIFNNKCTIFSICTDNHIKLFSTDSLLLISEININHTNNAIKNFRCNNDCKYSLIHYSNNNIVIYNTFSLEMWNIYIPDVVFLNFLSLNNNYPRIYILTKNYLSILQLEKDKKFSLLFKNSLI
jgi:hypothetical protein